MTGQHLTDEQFTDLLSGDYATDASRHMLACAQCQGEFERVQASIEDFVTLSLEWAERRASTSISAPSAFASRLALCEFVGYCCCGPGCGNPLWSSSGKVAEPRSHFGSQQPAG